jgi:hypothetical protein
MAFSLNFITPSKEERMNICGKNIITFSAAILLILAFAFFSGCKGKKEMGVTSHLRKVPDIRKRVAQYAPTIITFDQKLLNDEQKQVLGKLIEAAKYMDNIFWRQAYHEGLFMKNLLELSGDRADLNYLRFLVMNFGPFDRLDKNRAFIGTAIKPSGAGFYPPDLTQKEFQEYIAAHPEVKENFESPYTVIKRQGEELVAVPYNEEYMDELESAARCLMEAADITSNLSLKRYLDQRAEDLLGNNYYESDCLWIDLKDNVVEIVIGPFEVYEDNLMGIKAAYEAFVYINDLEEMKKIKGYLDYLDEMQANLPVERKYKSQEVAGLESPLNVVIEVFTAGETKAGVQTLAFVLPNDERVREEKGTKKVFLKNMQEAKFNKILVPISERVLSAEDTEFISFYAYFTGTILHEIAHALGVNYVTLPDGTRTTVNRALKDHYSAIEEAKADIAGLCSVPLLIQKGWIPSEKEQEIYTTFFAGFFRSMRFGITSAHGLANLIEFNFMKEKGGFTYDEETGKFIVDPAKMKEAVSALARELLILEGDGNYENAAKFVERYGQMDELITKTIDKLQDIPVDIKPIFKH